MIKLENLEIGRKKGEALLKIPHLELGAGLHLLVAPNGFGKSTLFQTLGGVLPRLEGDVYLGNRTLDPQTDVLYLSEYLTFPKYIYPSEWISFLSRGEECAEEEWTQFRLNDLKSRYLGRMSQGERRKVNWLACSASRAPVLLMDEPLDGLDLYAIETARKMINVWKTNGRLIWMVAHQVSDVLDLADSVWLIENKNLVFMPGRENFRSEVLDFYHSQEGKT
jgi:ABC-2 type transport system ATP-binding protein